MADLTVKIAGVEFKNPVIPASGVFGYGREYEELFPLSKLGGIATKGTTITKRNGNLSPRIAETPSGMLNSVGLQNPGIDKFHIHSVLYTCKYCGFYSGGVRRNCKKT